MQIVSPFLLSKRTRLVLALNSKAHARGLTGDLTVPQWTATLEHFHYRCVYCGAGHLRLTVDHLIPKSLGGATSMYNLVPACQPCNHRKSNLLLRQCSWILPESRERIHVYIGPLVLAHYQQEASGWEGVA